MKPTGLTILETLAPLQQPERYWVGHLQHQNLVFPKLLPRNSASGLDDGGLRRFQGVGPVLLSTKCLMLLAGWKPWPCVAAPAGIRRDRRRRIDLARQYAPNLSDDDSLTRLQHLGGKTNLIDFTRDLNVALFFGSHHSPDRNGRVILMEEPTVPRDDRREFAVYRLVPCGNPASMTDVQKSVWVEPWRGCITERDVTIVEISYGWPDIGDLAGRLSSNA